MMTADIKVQAIPFQDSLCFDFDAPMLSAFPVCMEVFEEFGLRLLGFVIGDNKISVRTDRSVCFLIKKVWQPISLLSIPFLALRDSSIACSPAWRGISAFLRKTAGDLQQERFCLS